MSSQIVALDRKSALTETRTGGKGAGLARLLRWGFRVPQGFVITASAFQHFLAHSQIELPSDLLRCTADDLARIRRQLSTSPIPARLARSVVRSYRTLGGSVAVRSSMVGEDGSSVSFAGQLDSSLNVQGQDQVLTAVRDCWISAFNWRLWHYLRESGASATSFSPRHLLVAVIVQRMVDAKAAGVAFSADPVTGQPWVVIEAVHGLGKALVAGLIEPDRHVLDSEGNPLKVELADPGAPVLPDDLRHRLSETVQEIASRAREPQDVEWAWDGANLYVLQSRPITTLKGQRFYSNSMVAEMMPGLVKPLVWSLYASCKLENVFGRVFTELIGPNDFDFKQMAKPIHSRVYLDQTMVGQLLEKLGLPANFFEMMSRNERAQQHHRPPMTPGMLVTLIRMLRFVWRNFRIIDQGAAFIEQHERDSASYRQASWSTEGTQEILAHAERAKEVCGRTIWFSFAVYLNMMVRNRLLTQMLGHWAPSIEPSDLVRGLVGLKSLSANQDLDLLAAQVREMGEETCTLLREQNDRAIRSSLSGSQRGQALIERVDSFLERYGFMSTLETDFSSTPWLENPTIIWRALGRAVGEGRQVSPSRVQELRESTHARVRDQLNWLQRSLFDRLLASTVAYIHLREDCSLLISQDSFHLRRVFLALANCLVRHGDLHEPEDIFYLTYGEVRSLVNSSLPASEAQRLATMRGEERLRDAQLDLPEVICGDRLPSDPIPLVTGQDSLTGIVGSSGLAEGKARVVLEPESAPSTLTRDDILVVPFTDVSWTPLFNGVGGIVAETGGQLSHAAIIAREYGLPAVVNVKKATQLICDGQRIIVDGNGGRVFLQVVEGAV